jgi:hypothetical protein
MLMLIFQETGDRRQETGGRRQEAGGRRQEAGGRNILPPYYAGVC